MSFFALATMVTELAYVSKGCMSIEHTIITGRPKFDHTVPTIQIVIDGDFSFSVRDIGLASGSGGALPYRP